MNQQPRSLRAFALLIALSSTLLAGCVGSGGYYDDGYGTGDYGVFGADYGGWGPGFGIGPYAGERGFYGRRFDHHWRGPRSDRIPSIAGRGRFGRVFGRARGGDFGGHGFGGHGR